jgi:hypothetical protein
MERTGSGLWRPESCRSNEGLAGHLGRENRERERLSAEHVATGDADLREHYDIGNTAL